MINPGLPSTTDRTLSSESHRLIPRDYIVPFFLVTALFFLWGVPNNLNDVLIRQFMKAFAITRFKAGLVQSAFYLGYFLLSTPAALVMRRMGYKTGLLIGLVVYGTGCLLFWPAAISQSYGFFLFALFVIASGLAFLETGASPFIAQLGNPNSAAMRLNFAQAFNPLGAIAGVLVGTTFIFSGLEMTPEQVQQMQAAGTYSAVLRQETMRVIVPYLILGVVVLLWAVLIARTKFPAMEDKTDTAKGEVAGGSYKSLLSRPNFVQAVIAQFFYVGAQVGTWSYFIQYVQDYVHQPERVAGFFLSGTLVAFAAGRFAATYMMRFVEPGKLMGAYSLINVALVAISILFPGWLGVWAIFLTSFFMSLMFPTIFALGLRGLGANTKIGGSLLVMAIVGGAVFTPIMGWIAQATLSMSKAMLVPLSCYIFIAYFAYFGSRVSDIKATGSTS